MIEDVLKWNYGGLDDLLLFLINFELSKYWEDYEKFWVIFGNLYMINIFYYRVNLRWIEWILFFVYDVVIVLLLLLVI